MVGLAYRFHKVYYTTREGSFKIPFVRRLIKLLRAIPIPKERKNKKNFIKAINSILEKGEAVHFYPEAALWTYCEKIRNFKEGAFDFAVRQHVPIIPMVFQFRTPQGIRKFFKRKKDVTLIILKPVMPEKGENKRDFKDRIQQQMKEVLEKEAY